MYAHVTSPSQVSLPWPLPRVGVVAQCGLFDRLSEEGRLIVTIGTELEPASAVANSTASTAASDASTAGAVPSASGGGEGGDVESRPKGLRPPTTPLEVSHAHPPSL